MCQYTTRNSVAINSVYQTVNTTCQTTSNFYVYIQPLDDLRLDIVPLKLCVKRNSELTACYETDITHV